MSIQAQIATSPDPVIECVFDQKEAQYAVRTGELAGLRLSVLLTAKWEAEEDAGTDSRAQLREELDRFRNLYFDKIDEIAMTFGIQKAIDAKRDVERSVELPLEGRSELDMSYYEL